MSTDDVPAAAESPATTPEPDYPTERMVYLISAAMVVQGSRPAPEPGYIRIDMMAVLYDLVTAAAALSAGMAHLQAKRVLELPGGVMRRPSGEPIEDGPADPLGAGRARVLDMVDKLTDEARGQLPDILEIFEEIVGDSARAASEYHGERMGTS